MGYAVQHERVIEVAKPDYILVRRWARNDEIFTRLAYVDLWGRHLIQVPRADIIRSRWSTT
jgi:hypothetical protein